MSPAKQLGYGVQNKTFSTLAFRKKVFISIYDLNRSLKSKCILRAAGEKSSSDELIDTLLVSG